MSEWKRLKPGQIVEAGWWVRLSTGEIRPAGQSFSVGSSGHTHYWAPNPPPFDVLECGWGHLAKLVSTEDEGIEWFHVECSDRHCWKGPRADSEGEAIDLWQALMGGP